MNFERLSTAVGVNKEASLVTSKGESYIPDKNILVVESKNWIPTRCVSVGEDLSGITFGRMKVIGLARDIKKRWVVRCSCGMYTIRTAKAIKNPANSKDRCEECRHLAYLKRAQHYREYNRDICCKD